MGMPFGQVDLFGELRLNKSDSSYYVGLQYPTSYPTSSFYLKLPNTLPGSTQALTVDTSGNMSYASLGAGGTVTSVALSLPNIFSVSGSPVTVSGTLTATLASQSQNTIFAAPNGSSGSPSFRALVAADIPSLTAAKISDFDTQVRTNRLDQLAAPTASVSLNNQKITALSDGSNAQDAATWGQVQSLFNGSDNKASVRVATTASLGLTSATSTTITKTGGLPTSLDGITLATNDRILVKNESGSGSTNAPANGIYLYASGSTWTRATDADLNAEVTSGLFTFVEEGTTNGSSGYALTTANPITLGTTQLTFTQVSGAGQITAGADRPEHRQANGQPLSHTVIMQNQSNLV